MTATLTLGLFAVVASDFGLRNWTFAAGIYGPSAVGRHDYPTYGAQAFQLTKMDVLMAYYNVAAAKVSAVHALAEAPDAWQIQNGVAWFSAVQGQDLDRALDLAQRADVAMYTAKAAGKRRFAVFDPAMHASIVARHELSAELARSVAREELTASPECATRPCRKAIVAACVRLLTPSLASTRRT